MAARAAYLPLFAKAQVVLGFGMLVVFAVLYPQRKSEADAYARAPICADHAADMTACRRMIVAEVVHVECPRENRGLESCQLELRLEGRKTFIRLLREMSSRLGPGSLLRVEVLGNGPTAAEVDGRLVREYGSPEMAMAKLRLMVLVNGVLALAAAGYLLWRRRHSAKSGVDA